MSVLLLSTYDLGRQPFGLASPAAWLRRAGLEVTVCDLSRDSLPTSSAGRATLVACFLPMHTATRLALPVFDRLRALNPTATLCAYGVYAPLSEALLRDHGVTVVLGPEAEAELVALALAPQHRAPTSSYPADAPPRLAFITPDRAGLPALERYAAVQMPDGSRRVCGATETTRGCKHRCRHCPIVPIYDGHFRVVPVDVVMADIDQQVASGAEHLTFGDPDFFNGPGHAVRVIEALHARHPSLSYDVTIKVEHLLAQRALLPSLVRTGCLFVTSAVESLDDDVLEKLEKGHTRSDVIASASLCANAGLTLAPTFVAFTPWTTLTGYHDLLETTASLGLAEHVAPLQWGLRLLVTHGSRLLELADIRRSVQSFDRHTLTYPWQHDDPEIDHLQTDVMRMVGLGASQSRRELFEAVAARAGLARWAPLPARATVPYLDEPWFC